MRLTTERRQVADKRKVKVIKVPKAGPHRAPGLLKVAKALELAAKLEQRVELEAEEVLGWTLYRLSIKTTKASKGSKR